MAIWLLFIATSVLSKLPDSDLDVYFKADTVNAFLSEISTQNSSVVELSGEDDYKYLTLRSNVYPNYKLPTTVLVGSLHGGFPFSTYTVLYYLDKFVNEYSTNKDIKYIVDNTRLIFIPIANYKAYRKTEEIFGTNTSFTVILTDLEGDDWNCSENEYAGINPDSNFPTNFVKGKDKCSENGYSGDSTLDSSVTKHLYDITKSFEPNVIFYFDNVGGNIFYPSATNNSAPLTGDQNEYYTYVDKKKVKDMEYMQFSEKSNKYGSYLDFANSTSSLIFEIQPKAIETATKDEVSKAAEEFWDFIVLGIQYHNVKIDKKNLYMIETKCKENCETYEKNITFKLTLESEHYAPYYCNIEIDPKFESKNITFSELKATEIIIYENSKNSTERKLTECSNSDNVVKCSSVKIEGFKALTIEVTYKVPKGFEDDFDFVSTITATEGYYPFDTIDYSKKDLEEESDDDDDGDGHNGRDRRRGVVTGLVLLIVLLILLLIAGIILCCAQKNKTPEEPQQFGNANVV